MNKISIVLIYLNVFTFQIYGQIYTEQHIIYSSNLQEERTISVSLPNDYMENKNNYPVLYLLDGEIIFDFAKGTVDFLTNDFGYLPEMIVVSIPNTIRERDMTVTLKQDDPYTNFVKFLNHELVPYVTNNYRANNFNILYGFSSSSGICGYFLTEIPETFKGYILSGTGIGNGFKKFITAKLTNDHFNQKTFFYANTEKGFREPFLQRYKMVIDSIKPNNLNYKFETLDETHVGTMQVGLVDGLKFIFSDFFIPDTIVSKGYEEIQDYYSRIKKNYTFEFNIPIGAIHESCGILYHNNKKDDAVELLKYGIELYPFSSLLYGSLAELYKSESQIELAKKYYKMALELSSENIQDYLKYRTLLKELSQ